MLFFYLAAVGGEPLYHLERENFFSVGIGQLSALTRRRGRAVVDARPRH